MQELSKRGIALLKRLEGLGGKPSLKAYPDSGGTWTIGWGTISLYGVPVKEGDQINVDEARSHFTAELVRFEQAVENELGEVAQNIFDAWVIFAYNIGTTGLRRSTALRRYKSGQVHEAAQSMQMWNKAGGKVVPALGFRRIAEGRLLEHGYYDPTPYGDPAADDYLPAPRRAQAQPEPNDLEGRGRITESRTHKTAIVSGGAATLSAVTGIATSINQASDAATGAAHGAARVGMAFGLSGVELLLLGGLVAAIAGIAYIGWCRYDDHKRGRR